MIFKLTIRMRLLGIMFITIFFFFTYKFITNDFNIPVKYMYIIFSILYPITIIYCCIYKETYEIHKGLVIINEGWKTKEIKIADILYTNINGLEPFSTRGEKMYTSFHNKAYIVTKEKTFGISTSVRNSNNKNLLDVLKTKYNKPIKSDSIKSR